MVSQDSLVSQSNTTFVRSFGNTTYLFRHAWEDVVVLEGMGDWLWRSIAEPCSVAELADDVNEILGHDRDVVLADLVRLVDELVAMGAVELLETSAA